MGGTPKKPIGSIAIGLATKESTDTSFYYFQGSRQELKQKFAHQGLLNLLKHI